MNLLEKKELQKHSLGTAGTTKEKAASAQYVEDLAEMALAVAEEEPEYGDGNE